MTTQSTFKAAFVQMRVRGGHKAENLSRAERLIKTATENGARLVVLPEALTLGWSDRSALDQADEIPDGLSCSRFRRVARDCGVFVCGGLVERVAGQIFNSAVLIDPRGEIILHHRKIHELEIVHDLYALGDRLQIVETALGRIGIMICADAFARGQVITRTLGYMGAQVILSPSSWAVPAGHDNSQEPYGKLWLDNYRPVARDFGVWIAGVSNVGWIESGPWKGRKCIGCSLLVGPSGERILMGPYGVEAETILYAELQVEAQRARGDGWEHIWAERPS